MIRKINESINSIVYITHYNSNLNNWIGLTGRFIFLLLTVYTILILAWIGDDSIITFKHVLNFVNGNGISFNYNTRVQGFTHPSWFLILSFFYRITEEIFTTTIILNTLFATLAIVMLFVIDKFVNRGIISIFSPIYLLIFSWSFCEYTTSGLENSFSYFLVACLIYLISQKHSTYNFQFTFFVLALIVLTRLDYILLFTPIAILLLKNCGGIRQIIYAIMPGFLLILMWYFFATLYFGYPLPNTFYAKLHTGYPTNEVLVRGLEYFQFLKIDLVTPFIIVSGFLISLKCRNSYVVALTVGQILYLLYILYSGGDFMIGRHFSVITFLSVGIMLLASSSEFSNSGNNYRKSFILLLLVGLIIGIFMKYPFMATRDPKPKVEVNLTTAIDERVFYYRHFGLFSIHRNGWLPTKLHSEKPNQFHSKCGAIGIYTFKNPENYLIDQCGLVDPFIARIPAIQSEKWRVGHHVRKVPTGFGEFMLYNEKSVQDKTLEKLFNDIDFASRRNIFSLERFKAIWRLNSGFSYDINWKKYTDPLIWVPSTLKFQQFEIRNWENITNEIFWHDKFEFLLKNPQNASNLAIDIDKDLSFELYVNDELISVINGSQYCQVGRLVQFSRSIDINSVKLNIIGKSDNGKEFYVHIKNLHLLDNSDEVPQVSEMCKIEKIFHSHT